MAVCLLSGAAACTKVIHTDLRSVPAKYVVEGNVTNLAGPYTVRITQTKNFEEDNTFPGVSGATVTITDVQAAFTETLKEVSAGVYQTQQLQGKIGSTYQLQVNVGSNVFTASSTMPRQVPLDSIYVLDQALFGKIAKVIVPAYTDIPGQGDNYHFEQIINGNVDKTIYYGNDDFTDGETNTFSLRRNDPDSTLHVGDHVVIEMQNTDRPVYNYFYSMDQSATGEGNGIPANPVTNITGGALGYFSAYTSQSRAITVK
ncbi:DUF4249 domain-containing protein [Deminuibacter soli]|uniref:DUF4249 domain-containing protein n=2 Tax=Deminuibacter soli TaxID=2291815 RepID=A0A3E1NHQ4_9BACT|nr:DUF4249 domain-containing protein [Deminuibacter soli]